MFLSIIIFIVFLIVLILVHELGHFPMRARGNRELQGERGICPVDEIEEPEENEECCTELPHEVRHVKDVQHLECPDPDREIRDEDTCDVDTAYRKDLSPRHLHPEEECDGDEEN